MTESILLINANNNFYLKKLELLCNIIPHYASNRYKMIIPVINER